MIEPLTRAELIADLEAKLAALPTLEELQYRQGIGMENQIERTRLIGIRKATEEQLYYQRNRYEEM